jgi:hypothetical protein
MQIDNTMKGKCEWMSYIDPIPHSITTHAIFKWCILSMKLCPWNCALSIVSSYQKIDVAVLVTMPAKLPLSGLTCLTKQTKRHTEFNHKLVGSNLAIISEGGLSFSSTPKLRTQTKYVQFCPASLYFGRSRCRMSYNRVVLIKKVIFPTQQSTNSCYHFGSIFP